MPTHYDSLTIRLRELEDKALTDTLKALRSLRTGASQLLTTAGIEAAAELGCFTSTCPVDVAPDPAPKKRRRWPYTPETGPAVSRRTITVPPLYGPVFARAASLVGLSTQKFLVGSLTRWITLRKKADRDNALLQAIQLPDTYSES
ncbi:hypothetical protein HUA74_43945 [Myxococcus sp. CA051A]|uniref:hypothetical protein n=1 Tax=Myxococcus sp. CA051A TaxID=2741739 RepID=UPI00157B23A8|nr:hypothetical protein [Myxococcus sp. CA051A]NTX67622.1 hypothetical protein [Myxococcus sp. CA051A]